MSICDNCTEPEGCGDHSLVDYDTDGETIIACSIRVEEGSGEGPTGESACEDCDNMANDEGNTLVPYGDRMVPLPDRWECRENLEDPKPGHYCPEWKPIYEPDDDYDIMDDTK